MHDMMTADGNLHIAYTSGSNSNVLGLYISIYLFVMT